MFIRIVFTLICLAIVASFGYLFRKAYRDGRMQYGYVFGRKLYVYRDKNPAMFRIAFVPGLLFCIWVIQLAISGPDALGF